MPTEPTLEKLRQFLAQMAEATRRVLNGDTTLWKQLDSVKGGKGQGGSIRQ